MASDAVQLIHEEMADANMLIIVRFAPLCLLVMCKD